MFLEYAKLKGYIGLKRGSNIDEIEIPFYKMKSKICFIVGNNGSGKSTLREALNPLIDSNDCFIPGVEGRKELRYELNDGTKLHIEIIHGIKPNGDRMTAKAFIKKINVSGEEINLNPNGNIGSYKDIIEDVLELDPNFLLLVSLGSDNRGIADKTPSERKKIVNSRLNDVEVYNDIGRTITKRTNSRKAIINSITAKIDTIGNEEVIMNKLNNNNNILSNYAIEREKLICEKSKLQLIIDQLDPNKDIINKYNDLVEKLGNAKSELLTYFKSEDVDNFTIDNSIKEISEELKSISDEIVKHDKELYRIDTTLPKMLAEHEETSKMIQLKTERLNGLENNNNYEDINKLYNSTKSDIIEYETIFKQYNIDNPLQITKDEYLIGLDTLYEIKESLLSIDYNIPFDTMNDILQYVNSNTIPSTKELDVRKKECAVQIQNNNITISKLESDISKLDVLKHVPKDCKSETCYFIKDAMDISKTNPIEKKEHLVESNRCLDEEIISINNKIKSIDDICIAVQYMNVVKRNIDRNKNIIMKLPHGKDFCDINYFATDLLHGRLFEKYIDDLYSSITFANNFDLYRNAKELLVNLESEIKLYNSKVSIIEEIQKDLSELKEKSDAMIHELDNIYNNKQLVKFNKSEAENKKKDLESKLNLIIIGKEKLAEYNKIKEEIISVAADSDKIKQLIIDINNISARILVIDKETAPISKSNESLSYSIKMLEEYKKELEVYLKSINTLEIIKKHSTPKTGIQIVFMRMYFGKILSMTNELLSNFFGGNLVLTNYDITEDTFSISCFDNRSGLTNDDISSCSSSELCMIGTLLSYAFMRQSSSIYDLLSLDEVDAALDVDNRMNFVPFILTAMDMLGLRQCIAISHSSETDLSNSDIILLRQPSNRLTACGGNVIYSCETTV